MIDKLDALNVMVDFNCADKNISHDELEELITISRKFDGDFYKESIFLFHDCLTFYSNKFKESRSFSVYYLKLIELLENDGSIYEFRRVFHEYIIINNGKPKKMPIFPSYYNPWDCFLTKNQDAELSFYFSWKNLISSKNGDYKNDLIKGLLRATFLRGHAIGLSGIKGTFISKFHNDLEAHIKGGKNIQDRSTLAKDQLLKLWNERFSNKELTPNQKTSKAAFARYILERPDLIMDNQGQQLNKANGQAWYTSQNSITNILKNLR